MKQLLRVATYPAVMAGSVAAAVILLRHGVMPVVAILTVPPIAAAIIIGLEWLIPFRREWNRDQNDFRTDCVHIVLSAWAVESLPLVVNGALVAGALAIAGALGRPPWPVEWPFALQVALALVASELFHYTIHRALHRFAPLWKLHAVHHSARRLYWLNATRVHPFEGLFHIATGATALVLAGVPADVLTVHTVFLAVARVFQHSNLDLLHGPLNWIFSTNEVHRFHHSTEREEVEANFGTVVLVWDWVFGTRRATPPGGGPAEIGGPSLPPGWWGQVSSPFRGRRA
jgi:sterol desaturase/sphingolipid hydroxylase (fatty acid hydroxylase superfamily)